MNTPPITGVKPKSNDIILDDRNAHPREKLTRGYVQDGAKGILWLLPVLICGGIGMLMAHKAFSWMGWW